MSLHYENVFNLIVMQNILEVVMNEDIVKFDTGKIEKLETGRVQIKFGDVLNRRYLQMQEAKRLDNFTVDSDEIPANRKLTEQYRKFVNDSGPFYFFITLTFGVRTHFQHNCKFVNQFLDFYNRSLFKVDYYKRKDWLEGFAFFEKHPMERSINEEHVHILIKPNARFNDFLSISVNREIFLKAALKVKDEGKQVFNWDHIDIQNAYVGYKQRYLFKRINDYSLFRFKTIGKGGLSDNEYAVQRY